MLAAMWPVFNCGSDPDRQQCVSAPRECGQPGNNAGLELGSAVSTEGPCFCKQLCATTTGCAGWTFYVAQYYVQAYGGGKNLNCQLRSQFTTTVNNCYLRADSPSYLPAATQLCLSAAR
ncbi:unnamed protein product [Polarella glacialis]|uniref:Uncharacterized protein n=1 Tax=Polarella glacialis TaxID=89957 RepID=A0A813IBK1_POLGL|nr:unnamed protein product [Polarella glacialis]